MKKKKILKWTLISIAAVLVIMQFIRPKKNIQKQPSTADIGQVVPTTNEVKQILAVACNDCHSNNTHYPWYTEVMPVGWWINHHVDEGKHHLNFSEAANYSPKKLHHKLEEVMEEVEKGNMPPDNYTIIHKEAVLSKDQKQTLIDWAKAGMAIVKTAIDTTTKK